MRALARRLQSRAAVKLISRSSAPWILAACAAGAAACTAAGTSDVDEGDLALDAALVGDLGALTPCQNVDDVAAVVVASAATAEEYGLAVTAQAASATTWSATGNEALILEVRGGNGRLIGHLVLHQGAVAFDYGMHAGALAADEPVSVKVSSLSAAGAVRRACVSAQLVPASAMGGAGEGLVNAPIFRWPVQKRFDDLPMVLGWSKTRKSYQTVFSNENGGTVAQCGGGASGIQAEIARWSRAADIEGSYAYGGTAQWQRCTGTTSVTATPVRTEAGHPILYYGDGHNRLFESRGGYSQACGAGGPEKPNGDLAGWNINNPSNALADDDGKVVILRPLPVDLDALGYAAFGGRREALIDRYAPWLYRVTSLELQREGKIDNVRSLAMSRYLYVDVRVDDVGGSGDSYCAVRVTGGFKLRAVTLGGTEINSSQITADYAGDGGHDWKRVAIPLPANTTAADIAKFRFDAYDDDGIYLTAIGDAFIPQASGANGAALDYLRRGERALASYVDDDKSGCSGGTNSDGPGGTPYTCAGSFIDVAK